MKGPEEARSEGSPGAVNTEKQQVVDRFTNDACFKAEYVLSRGHLSLQYQRLLAEQITAEVNRLSEQGLSSDPPSEASGNLRPSLLRDFK